MSQVTDVYNALVSYVGGKLSGYQRLTNPYSAEDNNELILTKAWGIGFGPGENTERQLGCRLSISRSFSVLLVNQIQTTEHNITALSTAEKAILEDQYSLIEGIEQDPTLSEVTTKAKYIADGGITFLEGNRFKYFLVETEFEVEYFETI